MLRALTRCTDSDPSLQTAQQLWAGASLASKCLPGYLIIFLLPVFLGSSITVWRKWGELNPCPQSGQSLEMYKRFQPALQAVNPSCIMRSLQQETWEAIILYLFTKTLLLKIQLHLLKWAEQRSDLEFPKTPRWMPQSAAEMLLNAVGAFPSRHQNTLICKKNSFPAVAIGAQGPVPCLDSLVWLAMGFSSSVLNMIGGFTPFYLCILLLLFHQDLLWTKDVHLCTKLLGADFFAAPHINGQEELWKAVIKRYHLCY